MELFACYSYSWRKYILLIFLLIGNVVLFWRYYVHYKYEQEFYYVHQMLGPWLCISRGSAAVLNLNCGIILLPMCRYLTTVLRHLNRKISMSTISTVLDTCKGFHIACAVIICAASVLHFVAHMFNARNFSRHFNQAIPAVNGAHVSNEDPTAFVLTTVPGVTGILMFITLVLIVSTSTRHMRQVNYDLFWYTHKLIAIFYVLLLFHAFRGPIKRQINTSTHTPGCNTTSDVTPMPVPEAEYTFNVYTCQEDPLFDGIGCQSWMWILGPILVCTLDGIFRLKQIQTKVHVTDVIEHGSDLLEIRMQTNIQRPQQGEYVLIQCPKVSAFEWHPYSVCQCPDADDDDLTIYIRTKGDWSGAFLDHVHELQAQDADESLYADRWTPKEIQLRLDGPFGGPLCSVLNCTVAYCIAGGIGITPFLTAVYSVRNPRHRRRLKRLYLVWACRTITEIKCFLPAIEETHHQLWNNNAPDILQVQFNLTGPITEEIPDGFLKSRLETGRPSWDMIFMENFFSQRRDSTNVFVCGPKSLIHDVEKYCYHHKNGYIIHKESF